MITQEFDTPGEAILAHYGKKGMRWGHRDNSPEAVKRRSRNRKIALGVGIVGVYAAGYTANKAFDKGVSKAARGAVNPNTYKFLANAGISTTQGAAKVTSVTGKGAYNAATNQNVKKAAKLTGRGLKQGTRGVTMATVKGSSSVGKGSAFITKKLGSGVIKGTQGAYRAGTKVGDAAVRGLT